MELKNRSFQYGKVALAVRTQKHFFTVCAQKLPPFARTQAHGRTVERHTAVELLGQ